MREERLEHRRLAAQLRLVARQVVCRPHALDRGALLLGELRDALQAGEILRVVRGVQRGHEQVIRDLVVATGRSPAVESEQFLQHGGMLAARRYGRSFLPKNRSVSSSLSISKGLWKAASTPISVAASR